MKRYINQFIAICVIGCIALLLSCKKDENRLIADTNASGTVTPSATTLVLNKAKLNKADTSILFTITNPDYKYNPVSENTLQIDVLSDNWNTPVVFTLPAGTLKKAFTTTELNTLLLTNKAFNITAGKPAQIQVRIANTLSKNVVTYSAPVTITVTPFSATAYLYVPGAYQGWSPDKADSIASPNADGKYSGIINFTGSDLNFKLTSTKSWSTATAYGKGSTAGTISTTGDNLAAPASGALLLEVDVNKNTIAYTPQWSVIGDASPGSWDKDTNMFYDKVAGTWYLTVSLSSDGTKAIKFRFNNKWDVNLGGGNNTLSQGGANIVIPKTAASGDNYRVILNPTALTYSLTKI